MRLAVRVTSTLLALALMTGPASAAVQAVFVGIDRYANSREHRESADPAFHDLEDSVTDVVLFKAALAKRLGVALEPDFASGHGHPSCASSGPISTTLTDACATRAEILAALSDRVSRAGKGDLILFFFSGLGSSRPLVGGQTEGTLVPADGRGPDEAIADIPLSEIAKLEQRARDRGARVFSILEAALPDGDLTCGKATRAIPAQTTNPADPTRSTTTRGVLSRVVLGCDGRRSEFGNIQGLGSERGMLTEELVDTLAGGRDPWTLKPVTMMTRKGLVHPRLIGGLNEGATPGTLVYLPPPSPVGVTGGEPAKEGEAPWIAELHYWHHPDLGDPPANHHECDGSLIAARWVLTAAHCLTNDNGEIDSNWVVQKLSVRMGSSDLNGNMHEFRILQAIPHRDYCDPELRPTDCSVVSNDIALLLLDDYPENADKLHISEIGVAGLQTDLTPGTQVEVLGWGATSAENADRHVAEHLLQKASLKVVEPESCRRQNDEAVRAEDPSDKGFPDPLPDTLLCAGSRSSVQDACKGDSGGPLVTVEHYGRFEVPTLVGVVSFGFSCAKAPGFYTKVSQFRGWINMVMTIEEHANP